MKVFRFYHVLVACGAIAAYVTSEELGIVHAWLGYGVAALIVARLLLGLARKRGFEFRRLIPRLSSPASGPRGIRAPLVQHSLTLALSVCVVGAAGTGIAMDRGGTLTGNSIRAHDKEHSHDREDEALLVPGMMLGLVALAHAEEFEDEGEEDEEGPLAEVHETFGSLLLPLAAIHALYLLIFRFEFARFMLFAQRRRR